MKLSIPLINSADELPTDLGKACELILCQDSHIRALAATVEKLQKLLFGPHSEKIKTGEGQEDFLADAQAEIVVTSTPAPKPEKKKPAGHGRRQLPSDLPRRRVEHDVSAQEKTCSCGCEKTLIGEDLTEQLEYTPASLEVIVHVQKKYACAQCREGVVTAPKPMQLIEKGLAGPGLLAHVVLSKYADHLPLCRQERIFAREGLELSRTTLCGWAMEVADQVQPVLGLMKKQVVQSGVIHSDDTGVPVLAKDHTHRAFLWVYVGDDLHPYTVYDFTWNRSRAGPTEFLSGYKGYLQVDAYAGYDELYRNGVIEVGCHAHVRRKFVEAQSTDGVFAPEAVKRIGMLYEIERRAKSLSNEDRRAMRQAESAPLVADLFAWMEKTVMRVLPKSATGEALGYALSNRRALEHYLEDGRLDIDNNEAERALRGVVIGRKNWMFAGNERGGRAAATFFSLIESARRNKINPFAWLRDMFERLPGHPMSRIDEFLPDNWKKLHSDACLPSSDEQHTQSTPLLLDPVRAD